MPWPPAAAGCAGARPQSHSRSRIRSAAEPPGRSPSGPHGCRPALRSIVCCDGGTVLRRYQPHRRQILPPRRQMPVLGLRLPQGGPFRQPQLGPSAARFPLLARQPVAQGVDEVVVRELVIFLTRLDLRGRFVCPRLPFRVGRRDQPDFAVEDANQIIKFARDGSRSPTLRAAPRMTACGP